MVKSGCFGNHQRSTAQFFFEMETECKMSRVKLVVWSTSAQKGTNIVVFYHFEYGVEYGGEYNVESAAK